MKVLWLCLAAVCLVVCTAERGGSLRGALEALQRRQRGRVHVPVEPSDYETFYDFVPPQAYPEPDYSVDTENVEDEASPKYIVRLLENERPSDAYEYKIIKKKSAYNNRPNPNTRQLSPFRERSQHSDNDRLRDLFMDRDGDVEESRHILDNEVDDDIEYAVLLDQLWSKYKNNQGHFKNDDNTEGVVKLYKDKIIKKRFPNNWGPVAFKRKRSPDSNIDQSVLSESEYVKNNGDTVPRNSNYNSYEVSDNDDDTDKDDMREEYAIAFQPLNDDGVTDLTDEDQFAYETIEKRFPVTKRSSEPYNFNSQKKRFAPDHNKRDTKAFRNSAGTDPKIIRDLSKIFGNAENEFIKSPVKRNTDNVENLHDTKPPTLALPHNHTEHDHNLTIHDDISHEENGHKIHPPGVFGKEEHAHDKHGLELSHDRDHKYNHDNNQHDDNDQQAEKPIKIKKKSIDWSDYFGIDKRLKKSVSFVNNLNEDRLKKQYFDTFNKEVIYPLNSFRKNNYAKRNYVQPNEETDVRMNNDQSLAKEEKRNSGTDNESKLDNIDKKLKNMEGIIVDEALHYSNIGEELDSKEEQEMKEKLLSRLAAAYSLEKMRKALIEFKQSLQMQKASSVVRSSPDHANDKYKRVVIKKEKVTMNNELPIPSEKNDDFEDEQGAGHYLNGKMEEQLSEGYMGGSGSHHTPVMSTVSSMGACPVLAKIVQRCRGVDLLAGDRGQLFLPLCSLHQICYLCGEAPPTTCDLVFLSEADSSCEGDMSCQRAARSALMALRELHENLVDELDGECEASPCLPATLKLNLGWQRALHR